MALVENAVEVIVKRMEGSEQPTHQPAAAPAHRSAHTNIKNTYTHTMEYLHAGNKDDADARPFKSSGGKLELTKFDSEVNLI